jgi:hypothetical protein
MLKLYKLALLNLIIFVEVDGFSQFLSCNHLNAAKLTPRKGFALVKSRSSTQVGRPMGNLKMSEDKQEGFSDEAMNSLLKRVADAKRRLCEMPIVVLDAMLPRQ